MLDKETIRASVDILKVIGQTTGAFKQLGEEFNTLCCFHDDHHPSMWVNPGKGVWLCRACGATGDVFEFVMRRENCEMPRALQILSNGKEWGAPRITPMSKPKPERVTSTPPANIARPSLNHRTFGAPTHIYDLNDAAGKLIAVEVRYWNEADGKKEPRMWSWAASDGWQCKHPSPASGKKPLYGLDRLAERPTTGVMLVEGAKCAEASKRLLPDKVPVSWTGGAGAWSRHDWEPLRGRMVTVWPDADDPGIKAGVAVAQMLAEPEPRGLGCRVYYIDPHSVTDDPSPDGFDIAEAEESEWGTDQVKEWAKARLSPVVMTELPPPVSQGREAEKPPEGTPLVLGSAADTGTPSKSPQKPVAHRQRHQGPRIASVNGNAVRAPEGDPDPDAEEIEPLSDVDLADHLVGRFGADWRYVASQNSWYEYRNGGWYVDDRKRISALAVKVTKQALAWTPAKDLHPRERKRIGSKTTAGSVRDTASWDHRVASVIAEFDSDPWLLGVGGGVVDLRAGKLIEGAREQMISKRCGVAPVAGPTPLFDGVMAHVTDGDADLLAYCHRWMGYLLVGTCKEHVMQWWFGPTASGKSTIIDHVLAPIMGDYHKVARAEQLLDNKFEGHAERWARLAGARLVTCTELPANKRWAEARIKGIVSGDVITANRMGENSIDFRPQFRLMIASNDAPSLQNGQDDAMRRRLHIVPVPTSVPVEERDIDLPEKLVPELPAILYRMIGWCLDWQREGLGSVQAITKAVDTYMESMDWLTSFIEDCCTREPTMRVPTAVLYSAYKAWAEASGEHVVSSKRLTQQLRGRGFESGRSDKQRQIIGLMLQHQPDVGRNYPD